MVWKRLGKYLSKYERYFNKSVNWLASEYNYMKELQADLEQLQKDISAAKEKEELADIKKALQDFRQVSRSEKRLNSTHSHFEKSKKKLYAENPLPEGKGQDKLNQRIEVEFKKLIQSSSMFEGEIKNKLVKIEYYIDQKNNKKVQKLLLEVEEMVKQSLGWMAALSVDLKQAKKVDLTFHQKYSGMTIAQINKRLEGLPPTTKVKYLVDILSHAEGLITEKTKVVLVDLIYELATTSELKKYLEDNLSKIGKLVGDVFLKQGRVNAAIEVYLIADEQGYINCKKELGDAYFQQKDWKNAVKYYSSAKEWKLVGDVHLLLEEYEYAGDRYVEVNELKLAGDAYLKTAYGFERAGECYLKINEYKLAGDAYVKSSRFDGNKKAIKCYKECNEFELAGDAYVLLVDKYQLKRKEKFSLYRKALKYYNLAHLHQPRANQLSKIREIWKKMGELHQPYGEYKKAANCYEKAGEVELAVNAWKKFGEKNNIQTILANHKIKSLQVNQEGVLIKSGKWKELGNIYMQEKKFDKAVDAYRQAGEQNLLREALIHAGKLDKAAQTFETLPQVKNGGAYRQLAVRDKWNLLIEELLAKGDKRNAAIVYEKAKKWKKAADLWLDLNEGIRAKNAMKKVKK